MLPLHPGHGKSLVLQDKAVLCSALQQPLLLVLCCAMCGHGSPHCGVLGVFAAFGGVCSQPELPAAARLHPLQKRVVTAGLRSRSGAKLLHHAGQLRCILAEQQQIQPLSQTIQPPQPAAALPYKSAFHCAMQFLRCRQRSHGAAAGGIEFYP